VYSQLLAVPFDLNTLEVTGDWVSILENIAGRVLPKSGTLAYISQTVFGEKSGLKIFIPHFIVNQPNK
jgi:hypothetical protein